MGWHSIIEPFQGALGAVVAINSTHVAVAGGKNLGEGYGAFIINSATKTMTQVLKAPGATIMLALALSSNSDTMVAMGTAMLGQPVSYKSVDRGLTWSPSPEKAKGFSGAVAGHQTVSLSGDSFTYVAEYGSFENGTRCDHGEPQGDLRQCSGVLLTHDAGDHWTRVDWMGTDGRGIDAQMGAFPSEDVWYLVGGGGEDRTPPRLEALITKTVDGGKTFKTVFNVSAFQPHLGDGFGTMADIDCADENTCYATSFCDSPECEVNKTTGYGAYVHKTADGGASWQVVNFEYEKVYSEMHVLSGSHIVVGGGPTGALAIGESFSLHSTDAGATWTKVPIAGRGTGMVMGMAMAKDGTSGFATTCSPASQKCNVFAYTP